MAKTSKVAKVGVKREGGFLYFVDKNGDVSRAPMKKSGKRSGNQKVAKVGIKKRKGYMYFVDRQGDISEVMMSRSGAKRKPKSQLAKPTVKYLVYEQMRRASANYRAKKVLLAANSRNFRVSRPSTKSGIYGIEIRYEAKVGSKYQSTTKFVNVAKPASNVRLVNNVPQKYQ